MNTEVWKDIQGFEGLYAVSNHGRVKSLYKCKDGRCWPEQPMKLHIHTSAYQVVWLRKTAVHQKFYIHRLVAIHFLDPVDGAEFVNHKDKDRLHNHVRNLEWVTGSENMYHRHHFKRIEAPEESLIELPS